ncbi:hypothetical protein K2173_010989 [Erythroxylum novogranatense]|uniref:Uncharacterized protein n=1 Tax=Erythroxylum novogranatense TaxID=1862640 RepID=A0AAV8T1P5_9ROSI|nr:hypothetical protein K2173_010989 [Erythroxylum novogranatense]
MKVIQSRYILKGGTLDNLVLQATNVSLLLPPATCVSLYVLFPPVAPTQSPQLTPTSVREPVHS